MPRYFCSYAACGGEKSRIQVKQVECDETLIYICRFCECEVDVSIFKEGDNVEIYPNDNPLDCCAGKRGTIAHRAGPQWGVGWLLNTDHFCPIPRTDNQFRLIQSA